MPQQLIKVRPTKIEFIKLRRRLSLARRVQKIVKEKLSILTLEFLQVVRETVEARKKLLVILISIQYYYVRCYATFFWIAQT